MFDKIAQTETIESSYIYNMEHKNIKDLYEKYGLIDIRSLQPSIKKDIKYATKDNFTGEIL